MPDAGERAVPGHLVVGHISKAHGTKGELFVWPLTDRPEEVFAPGRRLLLGDEDGTLDPAGAAVVIDTVRPFKRGRLVKLHDVESREDVDSLAQRYLLLPADEVPPLEECEEFALRVKTDPHNYIAQPMLALSRAPVIVLSVRSREGEGTVFSMILPTEPAEADAEDDPLDTDDEGDVLDLGDLEQPVTDELPRRLLDRQRHVVDPAVAQALRDAFVVAGRDRLRDHRDAVQPDASRRSARVRVLSPTKSGARVVPARGDRAEKQPAPRRVRATRDASAHRPPAASRRRWFRRSP